MDFGKILSKADKNVFFSRNDSEDRRLGDLVRGWSGKVNLNIFLEKANVAIIGVPDDTGIKKINGRTGAKKGQAKIRLEFYKFTYGCRNPIDVLNIVDIGNFDLSSDAEKNEENMVFIIKHLLEKNITPIILGGSHEHSYCNIKGLAEFYKDKSIGVVSVDSHLDVRNLAFGVTSGTTFYRLFEENIIKGENTHLFGLKVNHNSKAHYEYALRRNTNLYFYDDMEDNSIEQFKDMMKKLDSTDIIGATIDIDACASADAPGASASYPHGFSAKEMKNFAYMIGKNPKVKMVDLMEVNPKLDVDNKTAKLGAEIIYYFLKGLAERGGDKNGNRNTSTDNGTSIR